MMWTLDHIPTTQWLWRKVNVKQHKVQVQYYKTKYLNDEKDLNEN